MPCFGFQNFSGKRCIATIHGIDWQRAKWGGFASKYIKFGEKVAAKYADEIIVLFGTFFIDPYGDVMPCNGTKDKDSRALRNTQTWDELWNSPEAEQVRRKVRHCDRNCWMIGSVSPAMHKYIWVPAWWVLRHKFKALFTKHPYSMYELKICRDYRDGKVTKEQLDKCSTCDFNAVVNDGLSEASKEQLKDKTGEEIVDADLAAQLKK